jgi:hypothetical protein
MTESSKARQSSWRSNLSFLSRLKRSDQRESGSGTSTASAIRNEEQFANPEVLSALVTCGNSANKADRALPGPSTSMSGEDVWVGDYRMGTSLAGDQHVKAILVEQAKDHLHEAEERGDLATVAECERILKGWGEVDFEGVWGREGKSGIPHCDASAGGSGEP